MQTLRAVVLCCAAYGCEQAHAQSTVPTTQQPGNNVAPVMTPRDVLDGRLRLQGQTVVVEVFETLWDAAHSSAVQRGEYHVGDLPATLRLAGENWDPMHPTRRARALPANLRPPLRVTAQVLADPLTADSFWAQTVLRVLSITPIAFPTPTVVTDSGSFARDPTRWEGRYVQVEGEWTSGFETSMFDTGIWLAFTTYATRTGERHEQNMERFRTTRERVRVKGFVHTRGGHFGHLGRYNVELLATELQFLAPIDGGVRSQP